MLRLFRRTPRQKQRGKRNIRTYVNGDLNEDCTEDWYVRTYKQGGLARLIIWTQAFEKFGACRLARANRILRYCHRLELEQSGAEGERNAGPFFPCPPWTGSIVGGNPLWEPVAPIGCTYNLAE